MEEQVKAFRNKSKKYAIFVSIIALSPILIGFGGMLRISPFYELLVFITKENLFPYVLAGYFIISWMLARYFKPSIKCESCNEELAYTYTQSKKTVIACPYCAASFKSH
ncbi:hypothetical protein tinsulaeT_34350 [Thalassotalea insulae]|uniref:Uncharacterized protein n=1 Tax=Thalassotalea insulae TaxID=2056778 RepID=A0ABQ6H033_9GAMM|nr:hypothetical protein [Thalassotalea insulae]GLX80095.1 hypothetical protein tinsulaeT_34350 [Thalassotalea insulae]